MHQKEKVHFQSEGLKVVGNLFRPQNFEEGNVSLPAILVAGTMTGVKEQVAGFTFIFHLMSTLFNKSTFLVVFPQVF